MSEEKEIVYKFTLGSGKVVLLREPMEEYVETATRIAGGQVDGENKHLFSLLMQKELTKLLLHSVDGKQLSMNDKENIKSLFTFKESMQLKEAVGKVVDVEDLGNLAAPEMVAL